MNPWGSPVCILPKHLENQIANLFRNPSPATARAANSGQHAPIEFESGPVPLNDGFGEDDTERLFPIGPKLPSRDPEQSVEQTEPRSWMPALEHGQLLSES